MKAAAGEDVLTPSREIKAAFYTPLVYLTVHTTGETVCNTDLKVSAARVKV